MANYENTVGWLALKLRADQLQKEQDQQRAVQRMGIQNTQQQISQIPQIIQNQDALKLQQENIARKHEASVNANEARLRALEFRDTLSKMLEEGRNRRADIAQEGQNTRTDKQITSREGVAEAARQNSANIAAGHDTVRLATASNPITGNPMFPQVAGVVGGGTGAQPNPSNLPKSTYKELEDKHVALENTLRRTIEVQNILNASDTVESDFGIAGTEVPHGVPLVGGASYNSIRNLLGKVTNSPELDAGTIRRNKIMQKYAQELVPALQDIGGKALTSLEAGGGLAQAGLDYDPESKKFIANPFRNKLAVTREGIKGLRDFIEAELKANEQQRHGHSPNATASVEVGMPTIEATKMPPPPSAQNSIPFEAPSDKESAKINYARAIETVKAKRSAAIEKYHMSPEQVKVSDEKVAEMLKQKYGDLFNPQDLQ